MHDLADRNATTGYDTVSAWMARAAVVAAVGANLLLAAAVLELHALPYDATADHLGLSAWWPPAGALATLALVLTGWAWWRHSSARARSVAGPRLAWSTGLLVLFVVGALGWTAWTTNQNASEAHSVCAGTARSATCAAPFTTARGRP
jgi:hypothetical protein